jgi:hypothetical protein
MWKREFNSSVHCPKFLEDEDRNPVTKRKLQEGGPAQRWFIRRCKKTKSVKPTRPAKPVNTPWKTRFDTTVHCPKFLEDEDRNPVTKRKLQEGGPAQRWLRKKCPKPSSNNLPEFVKQQGMIGLERLISRIQTFEDGKFLKELKTIFTRAYKGAERKQLPTMILDLGARKFKISLTGPMAKRLKTLNVRESFDAGAIEPDEVEPENFCQTRNIKNLPKRPPFKPQPHQIISSEKMQGEDARLLLEHGLGSGKTCTSAMIINEYLETHPDNLVYFFSPGGLRSNFKSEYCSFCPADRRRRSADNKFKNFRFFSLDDSSLKKKLPKVFEDCLVVVDEAQSLINTVRYMESQAVAGGSEGEDDGGSGKNLSLLFNLLTEGYENIKLLMLSGTPMPDTLDQHYNCLRLLNPELMEDISRDDFEAMFQMVDGMYQPIDSMKQYYERIHYFKSHQGDVARRIDSSVDIELEDNHPLSGLIEEAIVGENKTLAIPLEGQVRNFMKQGMTRKQALQQAVLMKTLASRRVKSCRLSNSRTDDMSEEDIEYNLERYAPKLYKLVENLYDDELCPGKQIVYCPFKEASGVNLIGKILSIKGISNVIYSGDVSSTQREKILMRYNAPENDYGDDIRVFIFTDAAAEGISLHSVRGVHLINESTYSSRMNQVIGRAIRYKSHERLPEDEREVTVFRYRLWVSDDRISADQFNYEKGIAREHSLRSLQTLIHEEYAI